MSKHRRGPWEAMPETPNTSAYVSHLRTGNVLADVYGVSDDEATANANLIAAAPDLYKAAQVACVALSPRYGYDEPMEDGYEEIQARYGGAVAEAYRMLRAALDMEPQRGSD